MKRSRDTTIIEYRANAPEEFERFRARVEALYPDMKVVREKPPTQEQIERTDEKRQERLLARAAVRKLPKVVPGDRRRVRIPGFKP